MTKHLIVIAWLIISNALWAQDPNFHIYLCFGQSNMEGQATIQSQDLTSDSRFKTFQALDCPNLGRSKGNWYNAVPPTCQCYSKLSPADYFGKTMIANLPDSVRIGIINVAVAGCDIRLFDKNIYYNYDSTYNQTWYTSKVQAYNFNPYQYLINLAQLAKQDGVIKGILLHQGETNTGQAMWPSYVKKIYNDMLTDLSLSANSVPLLAGEVFAGTGNCCSSMNTIIRRLPDTIATAHVISSQGCNGMDNAHFDSEGYRKIGQRYAVKMLSLLGYKANYEELECGTVGGNWNTYSDASASNSAYLTGIAGSGNTSVPPTDLANVVNLTFSLPDDTTYYLYGRFNNSSWSSDAFWVKVDNEPYQLIDNLTTNGWEWKELKFISLLSGSHTISIACAEDGAKVDKVVLKNAHLIPRNSGEESKTICQPNFTTGLLGSENRSGFILKQNYPNPSNGQSTMICFELPKQSHVSLKIINQYGMEIQELAGKEFSAGEHTVIFNPEKDLLPGLYFYKLSTAEFSATKELILLSK